jgi:TonB family protein
VDHVPRTGPAWGHFSDSAVAKPGFRYYVSPVFVLNGDRSYRSRVVLDLGGIFEEMEVRSAGRAVARMEPRRVRVGGQAEPPRIVRKANPRYPEAAKAEGIEGDVVLRAVILMSGELGSVTVVESPAPVLSEGAIDAVKKWQFQPGLLNGQPVELSTQITIKFRLGE